MARAFDVGKPVIGIRRRRLGELTLLFWAPWSGRAMDAFLRDVGIVKVNSTGSSRLPRLLEGNGQREVAASRSSAPRAAVERW